MYDVIEISLPIIYTQAIVKSKPKLSRREFLLSTSTAGIAAGLFKFQKYLPLVDFPEGGRLGRVVWWGTELKSTPDSDSATVRTLVEDELYPWIHTVVGYNRYQINQNWVETPEGYVRENHLQPVENRPNDIVKEFFETSQGKGRWMEVTVPYVDLILANPPARAPWLKSRLEHWQTPRLYYSQIVWVDDKKTLETGENLYRINERWGYGDIFWADAKAFRPITKEELSPIEPEAEGKRIEVNIPYQTLSCFEGDREVYYCRVSTGAMYNALGERVEIWGTPPGKHPIWRKLISTHMSGGTTGAGWDIPGVGWTTLFVGNGVAIHSTYWHNNFGVPMSRGCVNSKPEDAKWIFRWTQPIVSYDPGDLIVQMPGGTIVDVIE